MVNANRVFGHKTEICVKQFWTDTAGENRKIKNVNFLKGDSQ